MNTTADLIDVDALAVNRQPSTVNSGQPAVGKSVIPYSSLVTAQV